MWQPQFLYGGLTLLSFGGCFVGVYVDPRLVSLELLPHTVWLWGLLSLVSLSLLSWTPAFAKLDAYLGMLLDPGSCASRVDCVAMLSSPVTLHMLREGHELHLVL